MLTVAAIAEALQLMGPGPGPPSFWDVDTGVLVLLGHPLLHARPEPPHRRRGASSHCASVNPGPDDQRGARLTKRADSRHTHGKSTMSSAPAAQACIQWWTSSWLQLQPCRPRRRIYARYLILMRSSAKGYADSFISCSPASLSRTSRCTPAGRGSGRHPTATRRPGQRHCVS